LTVELGGEYAREIYESSVSNSKLKQYFVGLKWRPGVHLNAQLQVSHLRRDSDQVLLGYTDNRVLLMVGWAVGEPVRTSKPRAIYESANQP